MSKEIIEILRHIFNARIDNANDYSAYVAWTSARDVVEYALANNIECLKEYDYLPTMEEVMIKDLNTEYEYEMRHAPRYVNNGEGPK